MFTIRLFFYGYFFGVCRFFYTVDAFADELIFDSVSDWNSWNFPAEAISITPEGLVRSKPVKRKTNAVLDARRYGGGIRAVGSNPRDAPKVIDGDERSGWSPNIHNLSTDGWIEIDLGRAVSAEWIELVFDSSASSFEIFELLVSNGMMMRDQTRSFIKDTLVYGVKKRIADNKRHRVRFLLEKPEHSVVKNIRVQVLKMHEGGSLTEIVVHEFGNNLALEALDRGGEIDIAVEVENPLSISKGRVLAAVDGLVTTSWYPTGREVNSEDTYAHIRIDLGAVYQVDQLRLISSLGGTFDFLFYELGTSDGSLAPDNTLVWSKHFSGKQVNLPIGIGLVDHVFGPVSARFVQVRWKFWDSNCQNGRDRNTGCFSTGRTEEIQVFGEGLPRRISLKSPLIDLGSDKNVYSLRWEANEEPGSKLELRSRSGDHLEERIKFFDHNDKVVTKKEWNRLIPSFRGRIDTSVVVGGDWSSWSRVYQISGGNFLSPSPTRYMELEAQLISDSKGMSAVALDKVSIDFSNPIAEKVVGEVYPNLIEAGIVTNLSYYLRAEGCPNGFDEIIVESTAPLKYKDVLINTVSTNAIVRGIKDGINIVFPRRIAQGDLIELKFESVVFQNATKIESFIAETGQDKKLRQRVQSGDAFYEIGSNTNVLEISSTGKLFSNLILESRIITPNRDGINDNLLISFGVINVIASRKLVFAVYDLTGKLHFKIETETTAGLREFVWDGSNSSGKLVRPGLYVVCLLMQVDSGDYREERVISVFY